MSSKLKEVTEATFNKEVLESSQPVLVDYSAEWCGPCKMMAPALEESVQQYEGRMSIAKIDVDANPGLASRYHVRGIPTLMLFKGGEVVGSKVGAMSKAQLGAFIDQHLETVNA